MSSGKKRLVFNLNERIVSPDQMRQQRLIHLGEAELWRYIISARGDADLEGGSVPALASALGTPLEAEIINGLLVKPAAGTFNLSVDPGVVMVFQPDAGPDDSDFKQVQDAGVSVGGLVIGANGTGSNRLDVVEFRVNAVELTNNESRDIYNSNTGLFAAASVTKDTRAQLEYRVRAGTPGSGLPASASGWCPIAVVFVPPAAASLNACTMWDVRPLLWDRQYGISGLSNSSYPQERQIEARHESATNALSIFKGLMREAYKGRRVGGILRRGTPGSDAAQSVDLSDAANQDNGAVTFPYANQLYVYLVFPNGWPRWARYTDGPSGRVPRAPCGIPLVSSVYPQENMRPSSGLTVAAIGVTTTEAMCSAVIPLNGSSGASALLATGREAKFFPVAKGFAGTPQAIGSQDYTITPASVSDQNGVPAFAREVLVRLTLLVDQATGNDSTFSEYVEIYPQAPAGGTPLRVGQKNTFLSNRSGASIQRSIETELWIPVPLLFGSGFASFVIRRVFTVNGPGCTIVNTTTSAGMQFLGYRW